jgi:hypothetical protein
MAWIRFTILLLLVSGWASISNCQTSGGGTYTNHQLKFTYNGGSPCYPYQVATTTGSVYSCVGGVVTLPLGSGGGASSLTVGTTPIVSGTNTYLEYNNNGVLGEIPAYWKLSGSNIYSPIADTVTMGVSSTSYDTVTDNVGTGGHVINGTSGIGGNDSYTTLLLHLENNATDSSQDNYTVTPSGMTYSNTIYKFGAYSATFDGSTSYFSTPSVANWQFGTNPFTVDLWFYPTGSTNEYLIGTETNAGGNGWLLTYQGVTNQVIFDVNNSAITSGLVGTPTTNAWNHIALVRNGNVFGLYLNGTSVYSGTYSGSIAGSTPLYIGYTPVGMGYYFKGEMDEVRISTGIARWTSNFTPPTAPYAASQPYLKFYEAGLLSSGLYDNTPIGYQSLVYNGITWIEANSSGTPYFPALTSNGVLTTSGSNGTVGVTATSGSGSVCLTTSCSLSYLNIKAGTATAGTEPLQFTAGVLNTTAVSGAMETDSNNTLYYTPSTAVRNYVAVSPALGVTNTATTSCGCKTYVNGICTVLGICT